MNVRGLSSVAASSIFELSLALLAVVLAYATSLNGYFHGDDFISFVDLVNKPIDEHLFSAFTFSDNDYYWRPLGNVYYRLIYETAGLRAFVFRAGNLAIFLITLVLLHRVCLNLGLSRVAAVSAVVIFGLYPNHVVSVAWITNAPRLLALAFFLLSLISVHLAMNRKSWLLEGAAWLCMVLACLSDEVTIALAPVPVAYVFFVHREHRPVRLLEWAVPYAAIIAILMPPQFVFTPDDEPRLAVYGLGEHLLPQMWSLLSQLTLPLAGTNPMDVPEAWISDTQWAAGAGTAVLLGLCLLFGSGRVRFLVFWVVVALAPFTLWDVDSVAPRYVYLGAAPFAVLVSILVADLIERVRIRPARLVTAGAAGTALVALAVFGFHLTRERDSRWERATDDYRLLADGLQSVREDVPGGARVVIRDGPVFPYWYWPVATVRTIYKDPTLGAISVPPGWPLESLPNDVVVYHSDGRIFLMRVR